MTDNSKLRELRVVRSVTTGESKAATVADAVRSVLDDWLSWAERHHQAVLTPLQFLALILWVVRTDSSTSEQEAQIIDSWDAYARQACLAGIIVPLHPVTLVPVKFGDVADWVLTVDHAQDFLDRMPVRFDCKMIVEHFRSEAHKHRGSDAPDFDTWAEVVAHRRENAAGSWDSRGQRRIARAEFERRGGAPAVYQVLADELGIKRAPFERALKLQPKRLRARGPSGSSELANALNQLRGS